MKKRIGSLLLAIIMSFVILPAEYVKAQETVPEKEVIATAEVISAGDLLIGDKILKGAKQSDGTYDFSPIFKYVDDYLQAADYAVINLETSIAGDEKGISGFPKFNTPECIVPAAQEAGFDMFLTASNHSYDWSYSGVLNRISVLEQNGADYIGTRKNTVESYHKVVDVNGIKIGMLNYTKEAAGSTESKVVLNRLISGTGKELKKVVVGSKGKNVIARYNNKRLTDFYKVLKADIEALKAQGAEVIVAYPHWGYEYNIGYNSTENKIAQKMCDYGVDVIIGGHPHVVEPTKVYTSDVSGKTTICMHSTGNFVSHMRVTDNKKNRKYVEDGALFTFTAEKYSDGTVLVTSAELLPTWVKKSGYKYSVVPLDKSVNWSDEFGISKTSSKTSSGAQSYKRTTKIAASGVEKFNGVARITQNPEAAEVFAGEQVFYEVSAVGENMTYQWQYSKDGGKSWKNATEASADTPCLTVNVKEEKDGRYYRCRVKTKSGSVYSKKAELTVKTSE